MQNNVTDHSQHLESGLSMAAIKNITPCCCEWTNTSGGTIAGLVNNGNNTLYIDTDYYIIAKVKTII